MFVGSRSLNDKVKLIVDYYFAYECLKNSSRSSYTIFVYEQAHIDILLQNMYLKVWVKSCACVNGNKTNTIDIIRKIRYTYRLVL